MMAMFDSHSCVSHTSSTVFGKYIYDFLRCIEIMIFGEGKNHHFSLKRYKLCQWYEKHIEIEKKISL